MFSSLDGLALTPPALRGLRHIPGLDKDLAHELRSLGIQTTDDLAGRDADELFFMLCDLSGEQREVCLLYVLRCAVYYATKEANREQPDPDLLHWWNWKDRKIG